MLAPVKYRCYVRRLSDRWFYAVCIDLDIMVEHPTWIVSHNRETGEAIDEFLEHKGESK